MAVPISSARAQARRSFGPVTAPPPAPFTSTDFPQSPASGSANFSPLVGLGGSVCFVADDGSGFRLWTSDGTVVGTAAVADIFDVARLAIAKCQRLDVFPRGQATTATTFGRRSRATGGTLQLVDLASGLSNVSKFTAVGGTTFFTASDQSGSSSTDGVDLWEISHGTATIVTSSVPWAVGPTDLAALNSTTLLFWADGGNGAGEELWKSDGTAGGTVMVKDIDPGPAGSYAGTSDTESSLASSPSRLTVAGGKAYFAANDGASGVELWESDATTSGTLLVKDIDPGAAGLDAAAIN